MSTVKTNYDELKAMTKDELADQLVLKIEGLAACPVYVALPTGEKFITRPCAKNAVAEWLDSPAEE